MTSLFDRRPTILDVMVLVAATAAGLSWIRTQYDWPYFAQAWLAFHEAGYYVESAQYLVRAAWPVLLAWTLAALMLGMRGPRPSSRGLGERPGLVACCAATLATAATFWPTAIGLFVGPVRPDLTTTSPQRFWLDVATGAGAAETVGLAVASAWLTQALGRTWHAEPTWIDRLGRTLGFVWIALFAACGAFQVALIFRWR
jgi:hypothetical protein